MGVSQCEGGASVEDQPGGLDQKILEGANNVFGLVHKGGHIGGILGYDPGSIIFSTARRQGRQGFRPKKPKYLSFFGVLEF
jgi:hypothetical protein